MMLPRQRRAWILNYLALRHRDDCPYPVTTLDQHFVDAYAEATGAKVNYKNFGADHVPALAADLRTLWMLNRLRRWTSGISGLCGQGFPRWTWSYCITDAGLAYHSAFIGRN